jgi:phosphopantetheinyl transferase (holo-ACP synthase)
MGVAKVSLSLTHGRDVAMAVVVLEGRGEAGTA